MKLLGKNFERDFFRNLNRFVEPAVRRGVLSPRCTPAGLIVLESIGFKSGAVRRTPLLATRLGNYTFISTARGKRSFWVKNLQQNPDIQYYVGGQLKQAKSFVFTPDTPYRRPASLPRIVAAITDRLAQRTTNGWAFAVLENRAQ